MLQPAKEFTYQIAWRARGRHPGRHASAQQGLGMDFHGTAPLISHPDPRRIDLRQTLRDPFEQVYVRIFNQKSAVSVYAVCDLSGSMGFAGHARKLGLAAEITASIAYSAHRINDPFGFIGFDNQVREEWSMRTSNRMYAALDMAERLADYRPQHMGADGLLEIGNYLKRERSLLFLISDFHMPLELLEQALVPLVRHHVVPIVLWDAAEYSSLPEFGITSVADCETGERRTLFLRKGYRERIAAAFETRREALKHLFMRNNMPPFYVENSFNADDLSEYFYQYITS
jgi:uncharacterized protein (DUF58 family)